MCVVNAIACVSYAHAISKVEGLRGPIGRDLTQTKALETLSVKVSEAISCVDTFLAIQWADDKRRYVIMVFCTLLREMGKLET